MGLFSNFTEALGDALSGLSENVKNTFFNSYITNAINGLIEVFKVSTQPIAFFLWGVNLFVWMIKSSFILLIVLEAFIIGFSIVSGNGFKTFIEYNVTLTKMVAAVIYGLISLFIRLLNAFFNLIPL